MNPLASWRVAYRHNVSNISYQTGNRTSLVYPDCETIHFAHGLKIRVPT